MIHGMLSFLGSWSLEPIPLAGIVGATVAYLVAVRMVNRAHPHTPVPRRRTVAWLSGIALIGLALLSPIETFSDSIFTVHMVQHLLLAMVAPPLLALGAPATLALRAATPRLRRSLVLPILHSRIIGALSWPPLGWLAFAVVMWVTHFSPLFNAALEDALLHNFEHLLFVVAGLLFWWPVIGADPSRWRLRPVGRMVYLGTQMPFNAAVGLAIYFAPAVLYAHYATLGRTWGLDAFTDQQVAGIVMWGAGDTILLAALVLAIGAWLRAEEKRSRRIERRAVQP
jgi:putative copper resistance protein D